MKESSSQQLLPKRKLVKRLPRLMPVGDGTLLRDCLSLFAGGFMLAGARFTGEVLPIAAGLTAALSFGVRSLMAALGAVFGYLFLWGGVESAQYIALTVLMLAAVVVFQGTSLPATRWFFPLMASIVTAVLGAVYLLGGSPALSDVGIYLLRCLLAGGATAILRPALHGESRSKVFLTAVLISGASGLGGPVDLGLLGATALMIASPELALIAIVGVTLDLTGGFGHCATAALLLPAVLIRIFRIRRPILRLPLSVLLSVSVLYCFDAANLANLLAVLLGTAAGVILQHTKLLHTSAAATPQESAAQHLGDAAQVLDTLRKQLPAEALPVTQSEADSVYDGAADRVCRCCARFHRCWENSAEVTYSALTGAAKRIMERGAAETGDFPKSFRDNCCHLDGFVTAINQELEGMLYRRRYRVQLRESRQIMAEEFDCVAEFLRDMQVELGAPERAATAFVPLVGVSTAGKNGSSVIGDRGACFAGKRSDFFVILCDGMGTGAEASTLSDDTVHLLGQLLKSGVAAEAALRVLNGVFLLRGTGCFATVDLLHIDMENGEAELLKWGAAPSYLRSGGMVKKIGTASPPPGVGVGGDHSPERYRLSLRRGEMLVLVSDGAGGEHTENAIAAYSGDSPRELAAVLIAGVPAEDDMTAVAVSLRPRSSCS